MTDNHLNYFFYVQIKQQAHFYSSVAQLAYSFQFYFYVQITLHAHHSLSAHAYSVTLPRHFNPLIHWTLDPYSTAITRLTAPAVKTLSRPIPTRLWLLVSIDLLHRHQPAILPIPCCWAVTVLRPHTPPPQRIFPVTSRSKGAYCVCMCVAV
jgi:hypothetical protein